jgi:hypothetical protein
MALKTTPTPFHYSLKDELGGVALCYAVKGYPNYERTKANIFLLQRLLQ